MHLGECLARLDPFPLGGEYLRRKRKEAARAGSDHDPLAQCGSLFEDRCLFGPN